MHSSCRVLSVGKTSDSCQYQRVSWPLQHGTAIQQARTVSNYPANCCRLQYIEQISLPVCRCHCYTAALCCWFSPLGQTVTRSGYVMLRIIESMEYFVCAVSDVCNSDTSRFIFVCLLSWLKQHCHPHMDGSSFEWVGSVLHAHMWQTDILNASSLGRFCLAMTLILWSYSTD